MQTRLILWGALFASTFLYLVIAQIVAVPTPEGGPEPTLLFAMIPTALVCAVMSFVLPRATAKAALLALQLPVKASESFGDLPAGTRIFVDPATARSKAAPALQTAMILRLALREAIALFGFVLAFLGFPLAHYIGLFVVAWLLFLEGLPRQSADDALLEAAYGAKLP